jgi:hypothetical protein
MNLNYQIIQVAQFSIIWVQRKNHGSLDMTGIENYLQYHAQNSFGIDAN